ncbi:MAG: hypothetical protein ACUVTU_01810 [Desulfurispora sp.]|uniref:hypothetical protein n=1 Tax=Desulfurispora sp. TaxID=3014275 RepID=UPI00404A8F6A
MREEALRASVRWEKPASQQQADTGTNQLVELRRQLIATGYNATEVDYLISSVAGTASFQQMDPATRQKVRQFMENQLTVARGCLQLVNNGSSQQ